MCPYLQMAPKEQRVDRNKAAAFPDLEQLLFAWVSEHCQAGVGVSTVEIKIQAKTVYRDNPAFQQVLPNFKLLSIGATALCTAIPLGLPSIKMCVSKYSEFVQHREWLQNYQGGRVDLEKDDSSGIAVVTLNHTDRMNALSGKMMVDLGDIVSELENWSAGKGFVLHGAGNTFCSGGDLTLVKAIAQPDHGRKMCEYMQNTLWRLFNMPLISVALLSGKVLGGGAELAVACDFRLVTESAYIGFVQPRMGVSPGWGGGTRLVQLLGRTNALELLVSGKILNCEQAVNCGFAYGKVENSDDSLSLAKKWLQTHVKSDAELTRLLKKLVVGSINSDARSSMENEKNLFTTVWGGKLHLDAMTKNIKHK